MLLERHSMVQAPLASVPPPAQNPEEPNIFSFLPGACIAFSPALPSDLASEDAPRSPLARSAGRGNHLSALRNYVGVFLPKNRPVDFHWLGAAAPPCAAALATAAAAPSSAASLCAGVIEAVGGAVLPLAPVAAAALAAAAAAPSSAASRCAGVLVSTGAAA